MPDVTAPDPAWPDDLAQPGTPRAHTPADVAELARSAHTTRQLQARWSVCEACPRLVAFRRSAAAAVPHAYRGQPYWARPVPATGAEFPRVLIVGLSPSAHGGNRTGSNLVGDSSGEFLFDSLRRTGLATDGDCDRRRMPAVRIVPVVACAPPGNRPTPAELACCGGWVGRQLELALPALGAVVILGQVAWTSWWTTVRASGTWPDAVLPKFAHGAVVRTANRPPVYGCYHPSRQNTATGRLTPAMLDAVLAAAAVGLSV
ncbi:MAG TPA: uracil-DNA glycosylase family protein [Trebonia sp.]|nr:uracil-DNA glycosylase family protein [Trebonia sp.]